MSSKLIVQNKARSDPWSQQLDNPPILQDKKYLKFKKLIYETKIDEKWLSDTLKFLNIPETSSFIYKDLWKDKYGKLTVKKDSITWARPDHGYDIIDTSKTDKITKVLKFVLMAKLIEYLKQNNYSSFEEVDKTPNWNKATVYLDGKKIDMILWACALTGVCVRVITNDEGEKIKLTEKGEVAIVINKESQTFF